MSQGGLTNSFEIFLEGKHRKRQKAQRNTRETKLARARGSTNKAGHARSCNNVNVRAKTLIAQKATAIT